MAAALVAAEHWGGIEQVLEHPAAVNVAALALAFGTRYQVHEVRLPVQATVAATDLHSLPDAAPALIAGPCIIEVRAPGPELLFGSTASLGCYELDGTRYLVGLEYPDGVRVARWRPTWPGGELASGVVVEVDASLIEGMDRGEHWHWGIQAARFLVVLGLLLGAEGSPLRTTDDEPFPRRRAHGATSAARRWAARRVYLEGQAQPGGRDVAGGGQMRDDAVAAQVEVRGHLRRQPYGPGGTLRRWQYVAAYEARRWVAPDARVVVGQRRA